MAAQQPLDSTDLKNLIPTMQQNDAAGVITHDTAATMRDSLTTQDWEGLAKLYPANPLKPDGFSITEDNSVPGQETFNIHNSEAPVKALADSTTAELSVKDALSAKGAAVGAFASLMGTAGGIIFGPEAAAEDGFGGGAVAGLSAPEAAAIGIGVGVALTAAVGLDVLANYMTISDARTDLQQGLDVSVTVPATPASTAMPAGPAS